MGDINIFVVLMETVTDSSNIVIFLYKDVPQLEEKSIISHFAVSFFKPILTTGVFMFLCRVLSPS